MRRLTLLVAALLVGVSGVTMAGVGVTLKVSTLGLGADLTLPLVASNLNLRAGYNGGTLEANVDLEEAVCEGTITWETIPILLDWHPAQGEFRISGGVVVNGNKVELTADPKETFDLNGVDYSIDSMDGSIDFDRTAWYFGIGNGNAAGPGRVHFAFDLGVMFHGTPKAEASATASNPAIQAALNADLQDEVADFQKDLDAFTFYPVISMGVSFTF